MEVTDVGRDNVAKAELENAPSPMAVTEVGTNKAASFVQEEKALAPIRRTEVGREMLVTDLQ
jgi:hypothetical protein